MGTLLGNNKAAERLNKIIADNSFSHAYLFVGPGNTGKTEFAKLFGQKLLCEHEDKPCGTCANCKLVQARNHPDFMLYDGAETVTVDEIRELIHFLELKPYQAKRKVAVLAHCERLTEQASNSLLKTLEEPARNTIIIQTAEKMENLLDTIVSRSQVVNFYQVAETDIKSLIGDKGLQAEDERFIIEISSGRPGLALELVENPEKLARYREITAKFEKIYNSGRIHERLALAGELAASKEEIVGTLDILQAHFRRELIIGGRNSLKVTEILDKLTVTKELITKNINLQLALESLLIKGIND
jgi:DNA polymerase-3 subunit delta'